jgi:hypothetical protein
MSKCASSCIAQHHGGGQSHIQDHFPYAVSVWHVTHCKLSLPKTHTVQPTRPFNSLRFCIVSCVCLLSLQQSAAPHVAHLQTAGTLRSQAHASLTIDLLGARADMQDRALPHGKPPRTSRPVSKRVIYCLPNLMTWLSGPCALFPNVNPFSSSPHSALSRGQHQPMRSCSGRQAPQVRGSLQGWGGCRASRHPLLAQPHEQQAQVVGEAAVHAAARSGRAARLHQQDGRGGQQHAARAGICGNCTLLPPFEFVIAVILHLSSLGTLLQAGNVTYSMDVRRQQRSPSAVHAFPKIQARILKKH